jgi:hypothetical protein
VPQLFAAAAKSAEIHVPKWQQQEWLQERPSRPAGIGISTGRWPSVASELANALRVRPGEAAAVMLPCSKAGELLSVAAASACLQLLQVCAVLLCWKP